jgi:hypothetical protein
MVFIYAIKWLTNLKAIETNWTSELVYPMNETWHWINSFKHFLHVLSQYKSAIKPSFFFKNWVWVTTREYRFCLTGLVVSKTKKIQRLSKIFSAYFQRPLRAISCRKIASVSTIFTRVLIIVPSNQQITS